MVQVFGQVEKMFIILLKKDEYQKNIQKNFWEMQMTVFSNSRQIIQTVYHPVSGTDTWTGSSCFDVPQKMWGKKVTLKSHHHPI